MASIETFPDDPKYTIKAVSERTGVRPVTLRAWERRYDLLDPERQDNNYRLYSERDIETIRWITKRMDEGLSISNAVREFRGMRKNGEWPEALPSRIPIQPQKKPLHPPEVYAKSLYAALTGHDEGKAKQIVDAVMKMYDLKPIFFEIFNPVLVDIGEAWYRGEIRIATEHFASSFIEGILMNLLNAFPVYSGSRKLLVGCAPEEFHEIPPLMLAVLLRREGYQVEFLGADLPVDDLVFYAEETSPDMIILSAGFEHTARPLFKMQSKLNELPTKPKFGFGGPYFNMNEDARKRMGGIFLGATLDEAIQNVQKILA